MGKLIYSMITSLDGFVNGTDDTFDWANPGEDLHRFINEEFASVGTYLYGRRMYEVMAYWESAYADEDPPQYVREYAQVWQSADKIVYSTALTEVLSGRTRIERSFDPEAVRRLKEESDRDLTVDGPTLAAQAIRAGLVDEYGLFVNPVILGGGTPFFPEGARANLELLGHREFSGGVAYLRYSVRGGGASG
jgi:dihydrofolate reductase